MRRIKQCFSVLLAKIQCFLLTVLMPEYIKKVVFISSVYILLFDLTPKDRAHFKRINETFELAPREDLLMFPKSVINTIWGDTSVQALLREAIRVREHLIEANLSDEIVLSDAIAEDYKPAMHLANQLVKSMPRWLRYKKPEDQAADIILPAYEKLLASAY